MQSIFLFFFHNKTSLQAPPFRILISRKDGICLGMDMTLSGDFCYFYHRNNKVFCQAIPGNVSAPG